MLLILTSSPSGPLNQPNDEKLLDESNGFVDLLKENWHINMKGLIISASPDEYEGNDEMREFFELAFHHSGCPISFDVLDHRYHLEDINQYDFIMLGGGHVPTQQKYFKELGLRETISEFEGIVMGVSAGTMNCADRVYAQPEMPNESYPDFIRFIEGLGLTDINVLPHYQMVKDWMLDGQRLYEDITYADSYGEYFIALCDGSYIVQDEEETRVYGEAYLVHDGVMTLLCKENESLQID